MLTEQQLSAAKAPISKKIFLSGPAGTGKSTTGVERLKYLISNGIPSAKILILTPQRILQEPYLQYINGQEIDAGSEITTATIGGLARRIIDLFWPIAAEYSGVSIKEKPPVFLTLETAQYYMARLVRPKLEEGMFDSVSMDRNRLYSQIIDNLNKSAMIGFPYQEIGERLSSAWSGDPAQLRIYNDAQTCAYDFRKYCLENNLLDFSLQLEIFTKLFQSDKTIQRYLYNSYRHIIYDNIEEDIPVAHDMIFEWLPNFETAFLINDRDAGYRKFLGADPESAAGLKMNCDITYTFNETFVSTPNIIALNSAIGAALKKNEIQTEKQVGNIELKNAYTLITSRFFPEMLEKTAEKIKSLIQEENIPSSEIVILVPFLSDVIRFSIKSELEKLGISAYSQRPSRSLKDETASRCLLTLAELAHPKWNLTPSKFDILYMLVHSIEDMDLVRAQILSEIVYQPKNGVLNGFDNLTAEIKERITFTFGERYTKLRTWIMDFDEQENLPLDHFLRRVFGELLSQPGFGFHKNLDSARVCANLVESIKKFRWAMENCQENLKISDIGKEYIAMLREGVISAQYDTARKIQINNSVMIAPAHTFLMSNKPVDYQFWLDAGSPGWYERLFQPLTHPFVLSRQWEQNRKWTDTDEVKANNESLSSLVSGLLLRCRKKVFIGLTDLSESGYEQRGALIQAFQQIIRIKKKTPIFLR